MSLIRSVSRAKRATIAVTAALAVMTTVAACGSNDGSDGSGGAKTATMRVTVVPGIGSLPFRVAQQNGYFKRSGLNVKATEGFDIPSYIGALDRQFDAVMVTPTYTISAAAAGRPLTAYAGMESITKGVLTNPMITKDPSLRSLEDVAKRGATVGLLAASDVRKAELAFMLQATGAPAKDIKLVAVPFPDQISQLKAGRVDAAIMAVGFFEPLLKEGYRVIYESPTDLLVKAGSKLPNAYAHFVSSDNFVKKNMKSAKAFQTSIEEGIKWIEANPDEARKMFATWVGRDPATVGDIKFSDWKPKVEASDFVGFIKYMDAGNLLDKPVDADSLIDKGL